MRPRHAFTLLLIGIASALLAALLPHGLRIFGLALLALAVVVRFMARRSA